MEPKNYSSAIAAAAEVVPRARRLDITLRQNLDERIAEAQAKIKELIAAKDRMEKSGLLDMRIQDIQEALRW